MWQSLQKLSGPFHARLRAPSSWTAPLRLRDLSAGPRDLHGSVEGCVLGAMKRGAEAQTPQKRGASDTPTSTPHPFLPSSFGHQLLYSFSTLPSGWQPTQLPSRLLSGGLGRHLFPQALDLAPQGPPKGHVPRASPQPSELKGCLWYRHLFCVCKAEAWKLQERSFQIVTKEALQGSEGLATRWASSGRSELSAPGGMQAGSGWCFAKNATEGTGDVLRGHSADH